MNSLLLILGLLAVGSATNYGVGDRAPSRLPFKTVVKQKESLPVATSSEAELPEVVPSALDVSEQAQITLPAMPIMQPAAVPVGPPPAQNVPAEVPVAMPPAEAVAVSAEVVAESELPLVLEPAPIPVAELEVSELNQKKGRRPKHHWKKFHQKVPKKAPHHSSAEAPAAHPSLKPSTAEEVPAQLPSEPTVAPTVLPSLEASTVPVSREPAEKEVAMEAPAVPPMEPTTVPTTTINYELNEKAAEAYWKTFVPPVVTTVLPPAEGVPPVVSGAEPTQDVAMKAPFVPAEEDSAEQLPTNAEPAEEVPTMSPYAATVKSKLATLQAIPVTPEYVPLEPGPVVLDVPVTTVPPSTTTVRYVLNPEAAEKYWATAKFPAPTKAPVTAPPVVQPVQNVPAISEPTLAPPAGLDQAPQDVPAVPETPLVLLPPLVQPAPAIVEVPLVAVPPIVQPIQNVPAVPEPAVVSLPVPAPVEETTVVVESKPKKPHKPKHHEEKHRKKPKAAKATQLPSQEQPTLPTPVKPIGY
ncbi:hypothetical protein V3C99_017018 [Haemonchus contortus]